MTGPDADLHAYSAAVRQALGRLSPEQSESLLEDLDAHLQEVQASEGGTLGERLGPPQTYAAELRRAAGLPELDAEDERGPSRMDELGAWVTGRPETRAVLAFLPELRPAWWVLRAWVVVALLSVLAGGSFVLLPFGLLALPLLAAAIVVSVRLGRWSLARPADDRRRLATLAANSALALGAFALLVAVQGSSTRVVYADNEPVYGAAGATLMRPDGSGITNLYPYSADGRPLTGVLLYDQDGRPVDNLATDTQEGGTVERVRPTGAAPDPANAYPQRQRVRTFDETGERVVVPPLPEPSPSVLGSAGPAPTAAATSAPSAPPVPSAQPSSPVPSRPATPSPQPTG